jgi:hypothetical protein
MTTQTTIKTYEGKRMNVRVISWNRGFNDFQVQYEFARKGRVNTITGVAAAETIWRNIQTSDNSFYYQSKPSALAAARRVHARNNNY